MIKELLNNQEGGDHYKKQRIQPIEYILGNNMGFCEGCVVKYVTRYESKNGAEDLKKAIQNLQFLLADKYSIVSNIKYNNHAIPSVEKC